MRSGLTAGHIAALVVVFKELLPSGSLSPCLIFLHDACRGSMREGRQGVTLDFDFNGVCCQRSHLKPLQDFQIRAVHVPRPCFELKWLFLSPFALKK